MDVVFETYFGSAAVPVFVTPLPTTPVSLPGNVDSSMPDVLPKESVLEKSIPPCRQSQKKLKLKFL